MNYSFPYIKVTKYYRKLILLTNKIGLNMCFLFNVIERFESRLINVDLIFRDWLWLILPHKDITKNNLHQHGKFWSVQIFFIVWEGDVKLYIRIFPTQCASQRIKCKKERHDSCIRVEDKSKILALRRGKQMLSCAFMVGCTKSYCKRMSLYIATCDMDLY